MRYLHVQKFVKKQNKTKQNKTKHGVEARCSLILKCYTSFFSQSQRASWIPGYRRKLMETKVYLKQTVLLHSLIQKPAEFSNANVEGG